MRRRRWRTAMLWIGCTLCLLISVAFVASGFWFVVLQVPTPYGPCVYLRDGAVAIVLDEPWFGGVTVEPNSSSEFLRGWIDWEAGTPWVKFPLYAVFLVVAILTLLVWRFVPKFPRGHCRRCGYNLTGLTEARCPECGQTFEPKGDAP